MQGQFFPSWRWFGKKRSQPGLCGLASLQPGSEAGSVPKATAALDVSHLCHYCFKSTHGSQLPCPVRRPKSILGGPDPLGTCVLWPSRPGAAALLCFCIRGCPLKIQSLCPCCYNLAWGTVSSTKLVYSRCSVLALQVGAQQGRRKQTESRSGHCCRLSRHADSSPLSPQVTAMSVRLRFLSPGDAGAVGTVGRSASFAGFSSAQSRRVS